MKQKDFFNQLVRQGNINDAEATKFIEALADVEIPDPFVKAHENAFLTMDRAAAHKDIHGKIKREVLDPVDNNLVKMYEIIKEYSPDASLDNIIKSEQNTYNKIKAIEQALPEVIKKAKGSPQTDEETKKKLTEYEKTIQEFGDKFTGAKKEYDQKVSDLEKDWTLKFDDYKLGVELERLTNKYTLAEAFEKNRSAINKIQLTDLRQNHKLKLGDKNGQTVINVLDENGQPKYNGNTPVTIESLLDESYKPYLKQSDAGQGQETRRTTTTATTTQNKPAIRQGAPTAVKVR